MNEWTNLFWLLVWSDNVIVYKMDSTNFCMFFWWNHYLFNVFLSVYYWCLILDFVSDLIILSKLTFFCLALARIVRPTTGRAVLLTQDKNSMFKTIPKVRGI